MLYIVHPYNASIYLQIQWHLYIERENKIYYIFRFYDFYIYRDSMTFIYTEKYIYICIHTWEIYIYIYTMHLSTLEKYTMLLQIPYNASSDSIQCFFRFHTMLLQIPYNASSDSIYTMLLQIHTWEYKYIYFLISDDGFIEMVSLRWHNVILI